MIVGISNNQPFKGLSPHLIEIRLEELTQKLAALGIGLEGHEGQAVRFDLTNLLSVNGDAKSALLAVIQGLELVNADAILALEPGDPANIEGLNPLTLAVGRSLQSDLPETHVLRNIPVEEFKEPFSDKASTTIPLSERLTRAEHNILNSRPPEGTNPELFTQMAEMDLRNAGLLDDAVDYRDWMEPKVEEPAPLPEEFRTDKPAFRNPFGGVGR